MQLSASRQGSLPATTEPYLSLTQQVYGAPPHSGHSVAANELRANVWTGRSELALRESGLGRKGIVWENNHIERTFK
jgi:hypothetical protein